MGSFDGEERKDAANFRCEFDCTKCCAHGAQKTVQRKRI